MQINPKQKDKVNKFDNNKAKQLIMNNRLFKATFDVYNFME